MMKNWKMIMNRYRNSFYFILFSIFFLSENHAFSEPHGPEIIYHPFSKITPYDINNKWFPIGWSVRVDNIWGQGHPTNPDPQNIGEWENNYVYYLVGQGHSWVNCLHLIPNDNREAWGLDRWRTEPEWSSTELYKRALISLEQIKIDSSGIFDFKAFPRMISHLGPQGSAFLYVLHTSGTWKDGINDPPSYYNIPQSDEEILRFRINFFENYPQLGGWILDDEPYGGNIAEDNGVRDYVYNQLLYVKNIIETNDGNISSHPIHCIVRGYGNYDIDPCINPQYLYRLNNLNIGDYIHDDLYVYDFTDQYGNPWVTPWLYLANIRTRMAIKNLIEPICGAPANNIHAWMLWYQGQSYDDEAPGCVNLDDNNENGRLTEEQLRYLCYTSWINGAQGAMFWELSKSDPIMFTRARKITFEANLLKSYLLESDAGINATITSTNDDDSTAQFIIRKDPNFIPNSTHKSKVMMMICNNSVFQTNLWIQFPQNQIIDFSTVSGIIPSYQWSFTPDYVNNRLGVGIASCVGVLLHSIF